MGAVCRPVRANGFAEFQRRGGTGGSAPTRLRRAAPNPTKAVDFDAAAPAAFASVIFAAQYTGGVTFDRSVNFGMFITAGQTFTVNTGNTLSVVQANLTDSTLQGPGTVEVISPGVGGALGVTGTTAIGIGNLTIDAGSNLFLTGTTTLSGSTVTNEGTMWVGGSVLLVPRAMNP